MTLKDERSPKYAFPEAGTSLLKSPTKSLLNYVSHTFLNAGYWLAASYCTAAVALTATDAAGTLEKNSIIAAATAGAADPSKRRFPARKPHATERRQRLLLLCPQRHSPAGRGNTMALKDERNPKYTFPEAGTSLLKSPTKSLLYYVSHTFLNAGYWLAASCCTAAVALTATDAAGTLEKKSIIAAAAAGAADPSKRRFPARKPHATERRQRLLLLCPQRHSPAGRGNTMALKDERNSKYMFPEAGTSLLKSPRKSLLNVSRCWLLARC